MKNIIILTLIFFLVGLFSCENGSGLCLAYPNAQNTFNYDNPKPDYVVGIEIHPNKPNMSVEGGIFSISPLLSKGLSFDSKSGIISGIPEEEYECNYIVTYKLPDGTTMTSKLDLKIWDVHSSLTCGLTKLSAGAIIKDSFQCKSDKRVNKWSIEFNPSGSYPITISDEGVLNINSLSPPEEPLTCENIAGKSVSSTSIIISKADVVIQPGLNIKVDDVNQFNCGYSFYIKTIFHSTSAIIDDLEGLDGIDARSLWDEKLGGFLTENNVKYWNFTMEGAIYTPENGSYAFHQNSDFASYRVWIDGELSIIKENGMTIKKNNHNYMYKCSIWKQSDKTINKLLTPGYHAIKIDGHYAYRQDECIDYVCNDLPGSASYRLMLKWKIPGEAEEKPIQFYQSLIPYDIVYYLTFDSDYYTMPINSYFEIPFSIERGKPDECIIGDDRIKVDLMKKLLIGQINELTRINLRMECSSKTSTTNSVNVTIDVIDKYVKGIVGYYLKCDEFDISCSNPYTSSSEGVTTEIIRLEKEINEEYNENPSYWSGLTPNFASEYGVSWEGYLKIEVNGNYSFNLSSIQGSWLYIDYVEIINLKGVHELEYKLGRKYLSQGYHFIRVNYMKYVGGSGIKLLYKNELDSEYISLKDKLYFVPRYDFEYEVSYAVYIANNTISENIPYIKDNKAISDCKSNPSLPSGLELLNCRIRGNPKLVQDKKSYDISGKMEDGRIVNTTIQISIIGDVKPQGMHLIDLDNNGSRVDEMKIFIGNESHYLIKLDSGYVLVYEIPVIPDGLKYDRYTGSIATFFVEYLENYEIEIRAYYSDNEYVSRKVKINVISGCDGDYKPHYVKVVDKLTQREKISCKFKYVNNTDILKYIIPAGTPPLYFPAICLIPGDYKFFASDNQKNIEGLFHFDFFTDGKFADRKELEYYGSSTFDINTTPKDPTVDYVTKVKEEYYLNDEVKIIPVVKYIDNCEISPELPSFLHFDNTNCEIRGIVTEFNEKQEYTIIGSNVNGRTVRYLNLTFYNETITKYCFEQSKTLMNIYINGSDGTTPSDWGISIHKSSEINNENVSSIIELKGTEEGWKSNNNYKYDYCISNSEYTAIYRSAKGYGKGYIDILIDGIPVDRTNLAYSETKKEKIFHSTSDYNYETLWENSIEYEDGWDDPNREHREWPKSRLCDIEKVLGNVIYIRKIDRFNNTEKYNGFSLKVSYVSGIIIKVNGREIFRNNLPDGEISPSTLANNRSINMTDEVFILPIPWLEENPFEISIELHRSEEEDNFPEIRSSLLRILGNEEDCLILNKYTKRVTETNTRSYSSHVAFGFDENSRSYWDTTVIPGWAIMRYKDHFHSYFNQFSINSFSKKGSPVDFSLEGYNNSEWIFITSYTNVTYPSALKMVFTNYNISTMYSAIRFNFTRTLGGKSFDVYDINFHLCPIRYCKAIEDLPETPTGMEITLGCRTAGLSGNRTFYCNNDKRWSENENNCDECPFIIYKESSYSFETGKYYDNVRLFSVSGKDVSYSMYPEMSGLKIDKSNGLISGVPYVEQSSTPIYFNISNSYCDGIIIEIMINITASNIPIKIWSNDSVTLEAGEIYEDYRLFYVVGKNLEYKVDKLPNGIELDKNNGLINGMTIEEESMTSVFTALNTEDYVDIPIEINVSLPIKPKNIKYESNITLIFGMSYNSLQPYKCIAKTIYYSVKPNLPKGLEYDMNDGMINGKVNIEAPYNETYTFKCYNDEGEIINPITIYIEESIEPVIINHVDNITIEGGIDYDKIELCRVTGKNLIYSIIPNLPSRTLNFDSRSGIISGYISSEFAKVNSTIIISGSGKQVSFSFELISLIPDKPTVVPSTIISNINLTYGEEIRSLYLFVAVGTNLEISVNPELPKGLYLDSKSGEIYGLASEYIEKEKYNFTIRNPPSFEVKIVEVEIEFKAVYCESDNGFPRSIAERGGKEVLIECGRSKKGMKKRKCLLNDNNEGVWSEIDDSECEMSDGAIIGIAIGSVSVGLIVIIILVICLLRSGLFRHRARTQSSLKKIPIIDEKNEDQNENKGIRV